MLRLLFILMPSLLIACSKDKPAPVASAGKAVATVDAPVEPTHLRVEAITDTSARVRWDAVEGATDYDVNYRTAVGGRWTNEPHKGTRLYNTIYDLEPNTEYRWAVRAENRDGPSDWVFGEHFTTLPIKEQPANDPEQQHAEDEIFRQASEEIQAALRYLVPIAISQKARRSVTYDGIIGTARIWSRYSISAYAIDFDGYSISGRFQMFGRVACDPTAIGLNGETRGRVWVKASDSNHRSFFIGVRYAIDLDRRKTKVESIRGFSADIGKEFLVAIKKDLIEALSLALNTSQNNPNTFIDGAVLREIGKTDSFIHVEGNSQTTKWYFEDYCPLQTKGTLFNGELSDIRIDKVPVHIKGFLDIYRTGQNWEEKGWWSGIQFLVEMDITLSGGVAEGTLRIVPSYEWDVSHRWTLEELSLEYGLHRIETE